MTDDAINEIKNDSNISTVNFNAQIQKPVQETTVAPDKKENSIEKPSSINKDKSSLSRESQGKNSDKTSSGTGLINYFREGFSSIFGSSPKNNKEVTAKEAEKKGSSNPVSNPEVSSNNPGTQNDDYWEKKDKEWKQRQKDQEYHKNREDKEWQDKLKTLDEEKKNPELKKQREDKEWDAREKEWKQRQEDKEYHKNIEDKEQEDKLKTLEEEKKNPELKAKNEAKKKQEEEEHRKQVSELRKNNEKEKSEEPEKNARIEAKRAENEKKLEELKKTDPQAAKELEKEMKANEFFDRLDRVLGKNAQLTQDFIDLKKSGALDINEENWDKVKTRLPKDIVTQVEKEWKEKKIEKIKSFFGL